MLRKLAFVLASVALVGAAAPAGADRPTGPGGPFRTWNVTVTADPNNPNRVTLSFDSDVLGRRVSNTVWVPDDVAPERRPLPVLYFLHGSERGDPFGFESVVADQPFLTVVPDSQQPGWCDACGWVDGVDPIGVAAETHLYTELVPLVQAVFRVRRDRGGHAVAGDGWGGTGALVQAMRHPDRWVFAAATGSSSPSELGLLADGAVAAGTSRRGQGRLPHDEIRLRNIDPLTLAPNLAGTGVQAVVATPAGGVGPFDAAGTAKLAELGAPILHLTPPAGTSTAALYRDVLLAHVRRAFATATPEPLVVSHKTVDRNFDVWGYDVAVERPNEEFLNLLGARTDGRRFVLAGTGTATVTTPESFAPGSTHGVQVTAENGDIRTEQVVADSAGRLRITLELGPTRPYAERLALIQTGEFLFPHTLVEVDAVTETPDTTPAAIPDLAAVVAALPAPFDGWDVRLASDPERPPSLELEFTSPALGLRVLNHVWLPNSYETDGPAAPTLYWLHGTSSIECSPDPVPALVGLTPIRNCRPGGGYYAWNTGFQNQLARQRAVVVVPDTRYPHWCGHCFWVDGRDGNGLAAETHLHEELAALVEAMFNVRRDRGGRAVMGHSMGGSGALIQGFRHPDRYAFVGAVGASVPDEAVAAAALFPIEWVGYLRGQGYDLSDEIQLRNIDPFTLSPNMAHHHVDTMFAIGDGCARRHDELCHTLPQPMVRGAYSADDEGNYRTFGASASARMAELGVPHHYIKRDGTHESHLADTYARLMLDRLNRIFAAPVPAPVDFSYKTVDRSFVIWDYDVEVERPNDEFLNLVAARTDGTRFVLAGTGAVKVRTPAAFEPGRAYAVVVTSPDGRQDQRAVIADAAGRLGLELTLGGPRMTDERLALLETGAFTFPNVLVEVLATE